MTTVTYSRTALSILHRGPDAHPLDIVLRREVLGIIRRPRRTPVTPVPPPVIVLRVVVVSPRRPLPLGPAHLRLPTVRLVHTGRRESQTRTLTQFGLLVDSAVTPVYCFLVMVLPVRNNNIPTTYALESFYDL